MVTFRFLCLVNVCYVKNKPKEMLINDVINTVLRSWKEHNLTICRSTKRRRRRWMRKMTTPAVWTKSLSSQPTRFATAFCLGLNGSLSSQCCKWEVRKKVWCDWNFEGHTLGLLQSESWGQQTQVRERTNHAATANIELSLSITVTKSQCWHEKWKWIRMFFSMLWLCLIEPSLPRSEWESHLLLVLLVSLHSLPALCCSTFLQGHRGDCRNDGKLSGPWGNWGGGRGGGQPLLLPRPPIAAGGDQAVVTGLQQQLLLWRYSLNK